jgi:hypothetical protein
LFIRNVDFSAVQLLADDLRFTQIAELLDIYRFFVFLSQSEYGGDKTIVLQLESMFPGPPAATH